MHLIHDLRLILASISACIEMIRQQNPGQPLPHGVDHINRLVESGFAMVEELLVSRSLHPSEPFVEVNDLLEGLDPVLSAVAGPRIKLQTTLVAPHSRTNEYVASTLVMKRASRMLPFHDVFARTERCGRQFLAKRVTFGAVLEKSVPPVPSAHWVGTEDASVA